MTVQQNLLIGISSCLNFEISDDGPMMNLIQGFLPSYFWNSGQTPMLCTTVLGVNLKVCLGVWCHRCKCAGAL